MSNNPPLPRVIHAAKIQTPLKGCGFTPYLLLKEREPGQFLWTRWTMQAADKEREASTSIAAMTAIEEALRIARRFWKEEGFRTLHCGFLYTLPERDEHGQNALFYQMAASYSSPNGVYFDEGLGHNCLVQFASQEALNLWHSLKSTHKVS